MRWWVVLLLGACRTPPLVEAPDLAAARDLALASDLAMCPPPHPACFEDLGWLSGSCFPEGAGGVVSLSTDGLAFFCDGIGQLLGPRGIYRGECSALDPEVEVAGCRQTGAEVCQGIGPCVIWKFDCGECGFEIKLNFNLN